MTNKMLMMAAKAYVDASLYECPAYMEGFLSNWNPINNDDDALRLAVRLNLCIFIDGMHVTVDMKNCKTNHGYVEENTARNDGCILKATRLAIVRSAEIIGEDMK